MRKRRLFGKKLLPVFLAAAMGVSLLTGCGGGNASTDSASTGGSAPADSGTAANSGDPFDFESVSDVTFPLEEKLTLDVFVYASLTGGGTYQDNYVTDWIEEQTNIHLNFVYDVDGDDAKTKLNLVMTDPNNLPDLFLATGWTKTELQNYGQQGLIIPLNDLLADAPNWNAMNEESPLRKADLTMPDGNIYTYGDNNECFHCRYQNRMYIYMPWVEKLNDGKIPETTDELYEYLKKVKTEDPNGNGIADEVPMTGYIGGWASDPTVWMINSFVQCNNPLSNTNPTVAAGLVVNEEGKIEYSVMKDEYRDALRYINQLYEEGLLDPQTFTQDATQFAATLKNETPLVAVYPGGGPQTDDEFWANQDGEWQNWEVFSPVEGPDGVRLAAMGLDNYFGMGIGSISSTCEYPEIVVALLDFLASPEANNVQSYGPEGLGWQFTNEGTSLSGGTPTVEKLIIPEDYDWLGNGYKRDYSGEDGKHYRWAADASVRWSSARARGEVKVADPDHDTEYYLQKAGEQYEEFSPTLESMVPNLTFEGSDAQFISEATLSIGGYVNQALVQFVTGDMDIETQWEEYISTLESMGVQQYIDTYQKYYEAYEQNAE